MAIRRGRQARAVGHAGDGEAGSASRSSSLALLLPAEPGRRNRRTVDGVLVAATAALVGLEAVVARSASGTDEEIGQAVATLLGWAPGLWSMAFVYIHIIWFGCWIGFGVGDYPFGSGRPSARKTSRTWSCSISRGRFWR